MNCSSSKIDEGVEKVDLDEGLGEECDLDDQDDRSFVPLELQRDEDDEQEVAMYNAIM